MVIDRRSFLIGAATSLAAPIRSPVQAGSGSFLGKIVTEWLPDGRTMKLLSALEYISPNGTTWPVPVGTIVDGASIPSVFWSVIGGPFEGQYRAPSVIHDFYCDARIRPCAEVHRVFYDAMLTAGVGQKQAWLMFQAVFRFGPQWKYPKIDPKCQVIDEDYDFERCARNAAKPALTMPKADKSDLIEFTKEIEREVDPADLVKLRDAIR